MSILYGGTIFYKNDIIFEDNTFDMKSAHPVFVLFTTDMNEENAYVLLSDDKNTYINHYKDGLYNGLSNAFIEKFVNPIKGSAYAYDFGLKQTLNEFISNINLELDGQLVDDENIKKYRT